MATKRFIQEVASETAYYVAFNYKSNIFHPTIEQAFDNEIDANNYAVLMSRAKKRNYVVLKACTSFDAPKEEE